MGSRPERAGVVRRRIAGRVGQETRRAAAGSPSGPGVLKGMDPHCPSRRGSAARLERVSGCSHRPGCSPPLLHIIRLVS